MILFTSLLVAWGIASPCIAAPDLAVKRQLDLSAISSTLNAIQKAASAANPWPAILSALEAIPKGPSPTSNAQIASQLAEIQSQAQPTGYIEQAAALIASGLASNDLNGIAAGFTTENNASNVNPTPPKSIYPKKSAGDAPYSGSEKFLRGQIYIPPDFTYGKKPPVLLIPGTGERGGNTYSGNWRILLRGKSYADPVILNYPGYGLADAQDNAEGVAYAINYIGAVTGRKVSCIAWSQGNLNVQWALQYWPSTRKVLQNYVGFSAGKPNSLLTCSGRR